MKVKQLIALSVLALGVQGVAQATYPADAEFSQIAAYPADAEWSQIAAYPADAEWSQVAAVESQQAVSWGVNKRMLTAHNPFPFGGGFIDD
jgi:hypothetical protein